ADHAERVFVHHVCFGNHCDAARDGEQPANFEMLAGLRLNRFVGGDDHQGQIDAADAGQHVAHKALVARNVNESEPDFFTAGRSQLKMRETEIDSNAAALLFFQTIGINAGEGFDQRGLAVVNMAGSAEDDGLHWFMSLCSKPLVITLFSNPSVLHQSARPSPASRLATYRNLSLRSKA